MATEFAVLSALQRATSELAFSGKYEWMPVALIPALKTVLEFLQLIARPEDFTAAVIEHAEFNADATVHQDAAMYVQKLAQLAAPVFAASDHIATMLSIERTEIPNVYRLGIVHGPKEYAINQALEWSSGDHAGTQSEDEDEDENILSKCL